jgi:hypothetical protein
MKKDLFKERYKRFKEEDEAIQMAIMTITQFEEYTDKDVEESTIEDIKNYMEHLIATNQNKYNKVIHLARYYYYVDMKEHYIHMTKYFNALGVLEHIVDRISRYEDDAVKEYVLEDLELPPFGTDSKDLPTYTKNFLETIEKYIDQSTCNKILAGNNHQIPTSSFDKEKEFYEQAPTFEAYLNGRHKRKVEELTTYYENNQIWFEQVITPDVIEFVKNNKEILSGVIQDDALYITKIPYDINHFLETEDDTLKRYYACHCSFVRENIKDQQENIPKEWCYCSAGFAKHPFETILGQELDVELLSTPLDGDHLCRFKIDLSNVDYKK